MLCNHYFLKCGNDIYVINKEKNDETYGGFIGSEVQFPDVSGNPWIVKVLN